MGADLLLLAALTASPRVLEPSLALPSSSRLALLSSSCLLTPSAFWTAGRFLVSRSCRSSSSSSLSSLPRFSLALFPPAALIVGAETFCLASGPFGGGGLAVMGLAPAESTSTMSHTG